LQLKDGLEEALFNISQGESDSGEISFDELIGVDYDINEEDTFNMNLSSGKSVTIPLNQTNNDMEIHWWDQETDCGDSNNPPAAVLISIFQKMMLDTLVMILAVIIEKTTLLQSAD